MHWNGSGEGEIHFSLKCAASWAAQSAIHAISRERRAKGKAKAPTAWSLTVEAPRRCSKRLHFLLVCNCELACVAHNMLRVIRGFAWIPLTNEYIQTHQKSCLTADQFRVKVWDYQLSKRCFVVALLWNRHLKKGFSVNSIIVRCN